jgi:predicted anti-sigma-YlaC factor YlaD
MACERWRELLSAQLDGEDDPAGRPLVDQHLAGCADCREWLDLAAKVNRLTRTRPVTPAPDLTEAIMAAMPPTASPREAPTSPREAPTRKAPASPRRSPTRLGRWPARLRRSPAGLYLALAVVGAVQLILGLTQVGGGAAGGHVHTGLDATPGHLWHESAAWNVAVGAGYLFIALRRSRPTGLVPMLTAFVGMLLLLSVNDLSAGRVDGARLVSHGFVLAGYLLVVTLARLNPGPAEPPGARESPDGDRPGRGWRARFGADEPTAPVAPKLRLVPRGPMTAAYEEREAA